MALPFKLHKRVDAQVSGFFVFANILDKVIELSAYDYLKSFNYLFGAHINLSVHQIDSRSINNRDRK